MKTNPKAATRRQIMRRMTTRRGLALGTLALALALGGACDDAHREGDVDDDARLAIGVAPLSLPGVVDVDYRVRVLNSDGAVVWERSLSSSRFGDAAGGVSYVGSCDATASPNRVELEVEALHTAAGPLDPATWQNPAPLGSPVGITTPCVANSDHLVSFNLTILRAAEQGFFDIAVNFDQIFCSAKLDCGEPDAPINLLFTPEGNRGPTMVMAFACTSGQDRPTWLWMRRARVHCEDGTTYTVHPSGGPGNAGARPPLLFQTAVYHGAEELPGVDKCYWNLAFGVDLAHLATIPGGCRLEVAATASAAYLEGGATPADTVYPLVTWDVPFTSDGQGLLCSPPSHALNAEDSGVVTAYTGLGGATFDVGMACGDTPEEVGTALCDGLVAGLGEHVRVRHDSDGLSVEVAGVTSPIYRLPTTHAGFEVVQGANDCCVDPCCAE